MRNLNRRLAALEKGFVTEPTILTMPDGSTVSLNGQSGFLLRLLGVVFGGSTPDEAAQLDLIRGSAGSEEPGGGHLVELIRALLLSPVDENDR